MTLDVLRASVVVATVDIDEQTVFTRKLMGEHKIVVDTITDSPLPIQLGDYIEHGTEKYYLNTPPQVQKVNNFTYAYALTFESEIYQLYAKLFMDEGVADFSYHGQPNDFLLLLLTNMNSTQSGWNIADVDTAEGQTLTFSGDSCRTALSKIAEAFGMEYRLAGRAIYLKKTIGTQTTLQFEYGREKGLYSLTRQSISDKNVVTRVYGFGASRNINYDYRNGTKRLVFQERFLDNNVSLYGIKEGQVTFDDIFPQRTGTITAIDALDRTKVRDSSLTFDINDQLIEGTTAKIVFKTGALSGYEFEIHSYANGTKEINFIPFQEENGYTLPNDLNYPEVGDEYTLVDIAMPQSYITTAENNLKQRTQEYLDENSVPRVTYSLDLDEKYIAKRGVELRPGDIVKVLDSDLGINHDIRVSDISYPLVNTNQITATLADTIPYTLQERLIATAVDNKTEIKNVERKRAELARRSSARFRQLQDLVFDPDGYFDTTSIKPGSIETLMLSVGAKSQNFGLLGVTIQSNPGGDENALYISGGQLAHYEIEIPGLGYVWNMDPRTITGLDETKHYYVYAKCSKNSLTGIWEVSETPQQAESVAGHYLFNLGVLYAVVDGRRDFDFTNGMTFINGDTITTGTIKSLDGLNYFDLAAGKFKIGNEDSSLDFNVTEDGKLTLKGVFVSSMILADTAAIENLTVRNLKTSDSGRRIEILQSGNKMTLYNNAGEEVVRMEDSLYTGEADSGTIGGIRAVNPGNGARTFLTGFGVLSEGGMASLIVSGMKVRGSVVGKITSVFPSAVNNRHAAVVGVNASGSKSGYGGYFYGGARIEGGVGLDLDGAMHFNARTISTTTYLKDDDHVVSCYNTSNINVYLPNSPLRGRVIFMRRNNSSSIRIYGNGKKIIRDGLVDSTNLDSGRGDSVTLIFDGSYWMYNKMNR